eukprot:10888161-Lingulodinium_polyedra.AAC.1
MLHLAGGHARAEGRASRPPAGGARRAAGGSNPVAAGHHEPGRGVVGEGQHERRSSWWPRQDLRPSPGEG